MSSATPFEDLPILRRARGEFDGPWPMFVLLGGQSVPLEPDQIAAIEGLAAQARGWSDLEVRNFVEAFLRCERGAEAMGSDLMAFLKEDDTVQRPAAGGTAPVPTRCDLCPRMLAPSGFALDAVTTRGLQWAHLCVPCFLNEGCGIGKGWGQLFALDAAGEWTLIRGLPADE